MLLQSPGEHVGGTHNLTAVQKLQIVPASLWTQASYRITKMFSRPTNAGDWPWRTCKPTSPEPRIPITNAASQREHGVTEALEASLGLQKGAEVALS